MTDVPNKRINERFEAAVASVISRFAKQVTLSSRVQGDGGVDLTAEIDRFPFSACTGLCAIQVKFGIDRISPGRTADFIDIKAFFHSNNHESKELSYSYFIVATNIYLSTSVRRKILSGILRKRIEIWDATFWRKLIAAYPSEAAPLVPFFPLERTEPLPTTGPNPPSSVVGGHQDRPSLDITISLNPRGWADEETVFVLPTWPESPPGGNIVRAIEAELGPRWREIETRIAAQAEEIGFDADEAFAFDLSIQEMARRVIVAAAHSDAKITAAGAYRAVLEEAERISAQRLTLPLIGAGLRGPDRALADALEVLYAHPPGGSLRQVDIVVIDPEVVELGRRQGLRVLDAEDTSEAAQPPSRSRSHFAADVTDGMVEDKLDVGRQAQVFAQLLASAHVRLPLAIGLFGDWGSGKSFFMQLIRQAMGDQDEATPRERSKGICDVERERLKEVRNAARADARAKLKAKAAAGEAVADEDIRMAEEKAAAAVTADYCTEIAHITFNAWHYMDDDLWSSLARNIFEGVARRLGGEGENATAAELRRLASKVESGKRTRADAQASIDRAHALKAQEQATIASLLSDRHAKAIAISAKDLAALAGENWVPKVNAAVATLGLKKIENLETFEEALDGARKTSASLARLLPGWFLAFPESVRLPLLVVLAAGTVLLPTLPDIQAWIAAKVGLGSDWWGSVIAWLGAATAAAGWIGHRLTKVRAVVENLINLKDGLDAARLYAMNATAESKKADIASRLAEVTRLDGEIDRNRQLIDQSDRQIADAVARLHKVESGELVYEFVSERAKDGRYVDRSGIISILRRDLETLEKRLEELSRDKARVQRIILYVDDLDRCDPERVVEVLQAVHLLLAFELFAVIVAVDPRWLERALYERYLPRYREMEEEMREANEFSPQNYLEKIFQIPYRIPPMGQGGFGQLVAHAMGGAVSKETEEVDPPRERKLRPGGDTEPSDPGAGSGRSSDEVQPRGSEEPVGPGDGGGKRPDPEPPRAAPAVPVLLKPLEFTSRETGFITRLHGLVGTPRAAKRLVNVYALLRLEQEAADRLDAFIDKGTGLYRATLLLLAIDTGFPRAARVLRHRILTGADELMALIAALQTECGAERGELGRQFERTSTVLAGLGSLPPADQLRTAAELIDRFSFHGAEPLSPPEQPLPRAGASSDAPSPVRKGKAVRQVGGRAGAARAEATDDGTRPSRGGGSRPRASTATG